MELVKYKDTLYGKHNSELYVWDSTWETFRPIKKIGWNGSVITHVDIRKDLLDPWYGFGSSEVRDKCRHLTETVDRETYGTDISKLFTQEEWLRDRKIPLLPCAPRDGKTWARYLNTMNLRRKTIRRDYLHKTKKRV